MKNFLKIVPLLVLIVLFSAFSIGCGKAADTQSDDVLTDEPTSAAAIEEEVIEPWQDAYADLLSKMDRPEVDEYGFLTNNKFFLNNMDGNDVPELIVFDDPFDNATITLEIYTYAGEVKLVSNFDGRGMGHSIYIPANLSLHGFFIEFTRGDQFLTFSSVENGIFKETDVFENAQPNYEDTILNQELYNEYKKAKSFNGYAIDEASIQKYIYGGVLPSNPHIFATALQTFFEDAAIETPQDEKQQTAAMLADLDSDGVDEMIAVKVFGTFNDEYYGFDEIIKVGIFNSNGSISPLYDEHSSERFCYDGSMGTNFGLGSLYLTESNYVISNFQGGDAAIYTIGEYVSGNLNNNELTIASDGTFYFNGVQITATEYNNYLNKYGIEKVKKTLYNGDGQHVTDETAKIFKMTAPN